MVDMAFLGLVAGKGYPNPVDYAHVIINAHKVFGSARGGIILTIMKILKK